MTLFPDSLLRIDKVPAPELVEHRDQHSHVHQPVRIVRRHILDSHVVGVDRPDDEPGLPAIVEDRKGVGKLDRSVRIEQRG